MLYLSLHYEKSIAKIHNFVNTNYLFCIWNVFYSNNWNVRNKHMDNVCYTEDEKMLFLKLWKIVKFGPNSFLFKTWERENILRYIHDILNDNSLESFKGIPIKYYLTIWPALCYQTLSKSTCFRKNIRFNTCLDLKNGATYFRWYIFRFPF